MKEGVQVDSQIGYLYKVGLSGLVFSTKAFSLDRKQRLLKI